MENDIIREILWQLTMPNSEKSQIFMKNWELSPELMVSSLSHSSLCSQMKVYSEILSKLERLNQFIDVVERNKCADTSTTSGKPFSKMYRAYASGLKQILLHL